MQCNVSLMHILQIALQTQIYGWIVKPQICNCSDSKYTRDAFKSIQLASCRKLSLCTLSISHSSGSKTIAKLLSTDKVTYTQTAANTQLQTIITVFCRTTVRDLSTRLKTINCIVIFRKKSIKNQWEQKNAPKSEKADKNSSVVRLRFPVMMQNLWSSITVLTNAWYCNHSNAFICMSFMDETLVLETLARTNVECTLLNLSHITLLNLWYERQIKYSPKTSHLIQI